MSNDKGTPARFTDTDTRIAVAVLRSKRKQRNKKGERGALYMITKSALDS
jgi:hypothetical protein